MSDYGSCGFETIYDNVTHWMPMPEPLKEEQNGRT